jgi:hypothetical protein
MKKQFALLILLAVFAYLIPTSLNAQPYGYEGVQVCGTCHKTEKQGEQLKIWQESKHASAYKTLQTKEADEVALKLYNKKAVEADECLKCHASGSGVDAKLIGAKFKVEEGVQCETCHGPGSAYKSLKVMKSKEESAKNGLIVWQDKAEIEKSCISCHNEESPTYVDFKFDEMWAKIAHPVPKK